jgi:hypothetical protein
MKAKIYTALMLLVSINGYSQGIMENAQIDSTAEQKFVLASKNEVASSGRYKHLQVLINYNSLDAEYSVYVHSGKEINCNLEIKDQDDNVIFFKPLVLHEGDNYIPIETEDGTQTCFKLFFENPGNENSALYVFRFVKEITYSRR